MSNLAIATLHREAERNNTELAKARDSLNNVRQRHARELDSAETLVAIHQEFQGDLDTAITLLEGADA